MLSFKNQKAFTLVELIIVITVIAVLSGGAALSITANAKQSRDTRRKTDLQQIKAALEFYRSNQPNGNYPTFAQYQTGTNPNYTYPALVPAYLEKMPTDPSSSSTTVINYSYVPGPAGCNNTTTYCSTYTLTASTESLNVGVGGTGTVSVTPLSID